MPITTNDLSKLANNLEIIEILAYKTPFSVADVLIRILKLTAGDDEILRGLASYLNWVQLYAQDHVTLISPEPDLPLCLASEREHLERWRAWMWTM
jgi:hypothetical protein